MQNPEFDVRLLFQNYDQLYNNNRQIQMAFFATDTNYDVEKNKGTLLILQTKSKLSKNINVSIIYESISIYLVWCIK